MSVQDRAAAALLAHIAMAADGALFGLSFAYIAYRSIRKYSATSSALRKIGKTPSVQPSDLRSILSDDDGSSSSRHDDGDASNLNFEGGKLLIVRGSVEVKSAVEKGNWKSLKGGDLVVSQESGDKGVILQGTQTCVYNEWRGIFGWTADLRSMLITSSRQRQLTSVKMVPFILVEGGKWPQSDYVVVNMEGSKHPLPLTTVYQHLQPISASPYTFLQAMFGLEYPVGLLYEEKILPLGKEITAVGFCNLRNGIPEIKSCKDLPYFLSDLTKDQMVADLSFRTKVLMWSGLVFGAVAIGILGYSLTRNWMRFKLWRSQQRALQQDDDSTTGTQTSTGIAVEEELGEVSDGELCVVCLMRRRRSAFISCGHLVCCQPCALAVEREASPKCPVCRQTIRGSVRIYDS